MGKLKNSILLMILGIIFNAQTVNAHCEIPCGIYADSVRITLILEHITTIEKAMNEINKLSNSENINYNQLVRWVVNKEEHAEKIQDIVSQYFLHQRIKVVDEKDVEKQTKYLAQLASLHNILVLTMKTKQSTKLELIKKLKSSVSKFTSLYFHKH